MYTSPSVDKTTVWPEPQAICRTPTPRRASTYVGWSWSEVSPSPSCPSDFFYSKKEIRNIIPERIHVPSTLHITQKLTFAPAPGEDGQAGVGTLTSSSALIVVFAAIFVASIATIASVIVAPVIAVVAVASGTETVALTQRTSRRGGRFGGSCSGRHIRSLFWGQGIAIPQ